MNDGVQGRCFCGAVQFELSFPTDMCSHCHCESCRRSHGAAFDSHVSFEEHVDWLHVNDELPRYREKSNERI